MTSIQDKIFNEKVDEYIYNIKDFNGLCLSSAGTNIYLFIGVLHYLDIFGKLDNIKYYCGTSAGAVICLLLILGYKPIEIINYLIKNDVSLVFTPTVMGLKDGFGLYDITTIKAYFKEMIKFKTNGVVPTFKELYDKTQKKLYCTSYCLNEENTADNQKYFSHITTPDTSVLDAVISSCSIPFIFTKNYIDDKCYIDGAVFNHYPLEKIYDIMSADLKDENINIFSVRIVYKNKNGNKTETFTQYVNSILNILTDNQIAYKTEILNNIYKKNIVFELNLEKEENTFDFKDNSLSRSNKVIEGIKLLKKYIYSIQKK
jgi:predicted patatin/cPLA2 family phospholipase